MKLGGVYEAVYTPLKHTAGITSLRTGKARGNPVWRTDGVYLSVYCDHNAKIYWNVVLR